MDNSLNNSTAPVAPTGIGERAEYVAPRNDRESVLVNVFSQALKLDPSTIGVHDDFWVLGGDSQRMMQVVARAKRANLELTMMQVYEYPTVAQLAEIAVERTSLWKKIFT